MRVGIPDSPVICETFVGRVRQLKDMPYEEYLNTEYWAIVREWMLDFVRGRCQVCNARSGLQVHHNNYECRGEETRLDLVVLCRACHEKYHGIGNRKTKKKFRLPKKKKRKKKNRRAEASEYWSRANRRFS